MSFSQSHVDLMGNITFTQQQLMRRWDSELERVWNPSVQNNLRDFKLVMDNLDSETFPNYADNVALLAQFTTDKTTCYARRVQDEVRNALLLAVIEYERALRAIDDLELRIGGREGSPEQAEVRDPDTGEVLQQHVPRVLAIDPLPETIPGVVDGLEADMPNPAKYDPENGALARLQAAQDLVAAASQDVLDLASERAGA